MCYGSSTPYIIFLHSRYGWENSRYSDKCAPNAQRHCENILEYESYGYQIEDCREYLWEIPNYEPLSRFTEKWVAWIRWDVWVNCGNGSDGGFRRIGK